MAQIALTQEQVLAMDPMELSLAVAEHIFKAEVTRKADDPDKYLLIGHFGCNSYQPLSGESWQSATWRMSEEEAWFDCPKYGEDMSAAWEVNEQMRKTHWSTLDSGLKVINQPEVLPFSCRFGKYGMPGSSVHVQSDTAPEAITKAALLAVLDI